MKKLVIVLVVLVGLLVAIDFGTAAAAEYQVSKRLRGHLDLQDDPAVRINGFPFLVQALSGDYRDVEVSADRVTVARLQDIGVEATLRHVRAPFTDLVSGSTDSVRVDEVVGRVRIQADAVAELIDVRDFSIESVTARDLPATVRPVPDNTVKLSGTTDITGQPLNVVVIGSVELTGGQIRINALHVEVDGQTLPESVEESLLRMFTTTLDPGQLPFTVTPTSVTVDNGTLVVEGIAHDVPLSAGGGTG